jgi:hypothetical protein
VRPVVVYRAFPEAVTEVEKPVPVSLVFLTADGHQVVGEHPDLRRPVSPEDNNTGDIVVVISESHGMKIQFQPRQLQII